MTAVPQSILVTIEQDDQQLRARGWQRHTHTYVHTQKSYMWYDVVSLFIKTDKKMAFADED